MLISIACILLFGIFFGKLCQRIHYPSLFGMMIAGILLGPHMFHILDASILNISLQIRKIALIVILIRAGLSLNLEDLKKVGRPAILMCFVPAVFEMISILIFAPKLFGISVLDAAILGTVIAAVSPAVIVPVMIRLMDEGYGTKKAIPQLILAGASVDDIFVLVLFSIFTVMTQGGEVSYFQLLSIPFSLCLASIVGYFIGSQLKRLFTYISMNDTYKVVILLSSAFLFVTFEEVYGKVIPFASMIAVMTMGIALKRKDVETATKLSQKYNQLWLISEIFLFVLVGASIDLQYIQKAGIIAIFLIFISLIFRVFGVLFCLIGTNLNHKEKIFCMFAYLPKATVQAAIGGLPLAMGLASGEIILAVSVLAILITAPLGAILVEYSYKKCLQIENV